MAKGSTPDHNGDDFGFEIIGPEEIRKAPRGRKMSPETQRLATGLRPLAVGTAVRVSSLRVDPTDARAKARNGAVLRAAAKAAGRKVSIFWDAETGIPDVEVLAWPTRLGILTYRIADTLRSLSLLISLINVKKYVNVKISPRAPPAFNVKKGRRVFNVNTLTLNTRDFNVKKWEIFDIYL